MMRFLMLATAAVLVMIPIAARGHGDAQWIMDDPNTRSCCGPSDCFPAGQMGISVEEIGPDTWLVTVTPEHPAIYANTRTRVFREGDPRMYLSPDHHFWACAYGNDIRCFFRPGPGM
jgi:hypothetical protein